MDGVEGIDGRKNCEKDWTHSLSVAGTNTKDKRQMEEEDEVEVEVELQCIPILQYLIFFLFFFLETRRRGGRVGLTEPCCCHPLCALPGVPPHFAALQLLLQFIHAKLLKVSDAHLCGNFVVVVVVAGGGVEDGAVASSLRTLSLDGREIPEKEKGGLVNTFSH